MVRSYGQKYMTWYFDLFLTHICVFRVERVKKTFEIDFQCSKQLWITFKHHFQSFWPVWSLQKKFEKNLLTLSARSLLKIVDFLRINFFWNCKLQNAINACSLRVRQPFWYHWKGIFIFFKKAFGLCPFKSSGQELWPKAYDLVFWPIFDAYMRVSELKG